MQEFSDWMTTLQTQHSPASSYAETDCADSDSDDGDCQCRLDSKRKFAAKDAQRVWTRTAPISIPTSGRRHPHPHLCASVVESPDLSYHADMRLLRAGRYLHEHEDDLDGSEQELDEDDPAFYGNLAFFRSQCGAQPRGAPQLAPAQGVRRPVLPDFGRRPRRGHLRHGAVSTRRSRSTAGQTIYSARIEEGL